MHDENPDFSLRVCIVDIPIEKNIAKRFKYGKTLLWLCFSGLELDVRNGHEMILQFRQVALDEYRETESRGAVQVVWCK